MMIKDDVIPSHLQFQAIKKEPYVLVLTDIDVTYFSY